MATTANSQSYTTFTSLTTTTARVGSTSYTTFAASTATMTSASTSTYIYSFTMPAEAPHACYYDDTYGTFSAGEKLVGKVTSPIPIDFFIMSTDQFNAFAHGRCEHEYASLLKAKATVSYSLDWVVPSDGDYYFVFFNNPQGGQGSSAAHGSFSLELASSETVTSTIYSESSVMIHSTTTGTLRSLYVSTVQNYLGGIGFPISLLVIGVIVIILIIVAIAVIRKRRQRTGTARRKKTRKPREEKSYCINCGAELSPGSKYCNNCGAAQTS
jgi:hypothetical protein